MKLYYAASSIHPHTFDERIATEKERLEAHAAQLPPDRQNDGLQKKIGQLETAARISCWLNCLLLELNCLLLEKSDFRQSSIRSAGRFNVIEARAR